MAMRILVAAAIMTAISAGAALAEPVSIEGAPAALGAAAARMGLPGIAYEQQGCDDDVDHLCDVVGHDRDGSLTARFIMKSAAPGQPVDHFDLFFAIDPYATPLQYLNAAVVTTALGADTVGVGEMTEFLGGLRDRAEAEDGMASTFFHGTVQTIVLFPETGMMLSVQLAPPP